MFATVVCVLVLMSGIRPLIYDQTLSEKKAEMLEAIVQSLIAIVTLYVGAKIQQHRDK